MRIYRVGYNYYGAGYGAGRNVEYINEIIDFLVNTNLGANDFTHYRDEYGNKSVSNIVKDLSYLNAIGRGKDLLIIYDKYLQNNNWKIDGWAFKNTKKRFEINIKNGLSGIDLIKFMRRLGEIVQDPEKSKVENEFEVEDMLK